MVLVHERRLLGQILIDEGLIDQAQLDAALEHQAKYGGALGQVLVEQGIITQEDVLLALGQQAGMEVVDLEHMDIDPDILEKVTPSMANIYRIVPITFDGNVLTVAMADPMNVNALDDLRFLLNCEIQGAVASEKSVLDAIERFYGTETENIEDILEGLSADELMTVIEEDDGAIDISKAEELANAPPVVKLLNLVLLTAIRDQASDVHFEPFEDEFKIRYRIDGLLLEMAPPPRQLALAITSRIKVMASLDIAETRLPQDGRIELSIGGNPVDLRVSTLPTMFGESVVMRVLDRSVVALDLERLGLQQDDLEFIRHLVSLPNGIVLVTGPTGSGKTTTLYSALNEVNDPALKIITTEDPVEYDLDGIIQVQINDEIGVTYAGCLRSILRQDPDKILVGEIRDLETANIAIEASLTGHLVLSTLHTNDAPSTITRMLDMGLEPFLVSATLESIVAQRLVRSICSRCRTQYVPTEESLYELGIRPEDVEGKVFYYGKRCDNCNSTGYRGRSAIYEIMKVDQKIRDLIIQRKSTEVIRQEAMASGMRTLREAGILKIFDGITTIEEVVNETLVFT
ncbi:MAG: Flp pilus assembly complex ATPase component TadA [Planctomycetes bacterium]|nr:Flp pilus assembly complex ATPase component TadA [Planctomycetota bacterium]